MSKENKAVDAISVSRRNFVRKAVKAGYVVPVVGTFTMTGLMSTPAAAGNNTSLLGNKGR